MRNQLKKQHGITIAIVLLIIMIVSVIGLAMGTLGFQHLTIINRDKFRTQAFYVAESGLQKALLNLKNNNYWSGSNPALTNVDMPTMDGKYTVTVFNNLFGTSTITASNGTQVPIRHAYIISEGSYFNSRATVASLVKREAIFQMGLFAKDGLIFAGNILVDAYDSRTNLAQPGEGDVGTNATGVGSIIFNGSAGAIDGTMFVGPGANLNTAIVINGNPTITGERDVLPTVTPFPATTVPAGLTARTFPDSRKRDTILLPGNYTGSGYLTLASNESYILQGPGTYAFDGISIAAQGNLKIDSTNGPVKIYIIGNIFITGSTDIVGISRQGTLKPTDLFIVVVQQSGINQTVQLSGCSSVSFAMYAPNASVSIVGNTDLRGCIVARYINQVGSSSIHYDVALKDLPDLNYLKPVSWQRF